jgi:peptide/nickel transport system substrate-binding protein
MIETHVLENLVDVQGPDFKATPILAESYRTLDPTTWEFKLRRGVKWHNGDDFNADDVIFNFTRWMDPAVASSNAGLSTFSAMTEPVDTGEKNEDGTPKMSNKMIEGSVERVDDHTVTLHLTKPVLSVPEDLYNYPTAIVHRDFKPPFEANPNGTGPYTLAEFAVDDKCILKKAEGHQYWGGEVYLDEIHYLNYAAENQLTALAGGEVDAIYEFGVEQMPLAQSLPDAQIIAIRTAQTLTCRFRVDLEPFTDKRVRQAIAKSLDNAAIKALVFPEGGDVGENHHVAPIHPEYFPLPPLQRDVEAAKALLAEAGVSDLAITIPIWGEDQGESQQLLQQDLAAVGITVTLQQDPADENQYGAKLRGMYPVWPRGWGMGLPDPAELYNSMMKTGAPANYGGYSNEEVDRLGAEAQRTTDPAARGELYAQAEQLLIDDAPYIFVGVRQWGTLKRPELQNFTWEPVLYEHWDRYWLQG